MDLSPKSGETLIVCHIHSRSVGWNLYNSGQTSKCSRSLNLTHSISLPERGDLPREALDYGGLSHTNKSSLTKTAYKRGTENCRGYKSSPTLCVLSENLPSTSPQLKKESLQCRGTPRWQNVFIPESEMNEDEEDDDSDGDNLHKYHEGSSLQLHGNLTQNNKNPFSQAKENKDEDRRDSRGTPVLMDCDEQYWGIEEDISKHTLEEPDNCWAPTENFIESITQNQTDYITDSSCNSSDGVLVNFSAIYNKTNNSIPAIPLNLDSPVLGSGTVLLDGSNPLPSWSSHSVDPNCNIYPFNSDGLPSMESPDITMCLQSQARLAGSTQNYYKLVTCDLSSQSTPSPPWSSLTSFSETHSKGSCSPPYEYFLFAHSEEEEKEKAKFGQTENKGDGNIETKNPRRVIKDKSKGTKERKANIKTHQSRELESWSSMKTLQSQSWVSSQKSSALLKRGALQNSCPSNLDTNLSSPLSRQHATSFVEIARCKKGNGELSMKKSIDGRSSSHFIDKLSSFQKQNDTEMPAKSLSTDRSSQSNPVGACASAPEVVRYTKAQRPTFLPIQPFLLQAPSGKLQSKAIGSLLNQYISHKYSKPGTSKASCKSKAHPHDMQTSPLGSSSNIQLEAATCSDTCSTCTSSPILPHVHPQCTRPCTLLEVIHQDLMNRNPLMSPRSPQSPEQTDRSPIACSHQTILSQKHSCSGKVSQNCLPEQVPLVLTQTNTPEVLRENITGFLNASNLLQQCSSPAITSVTSLTSITSLISLPSDGQKSLCPFDTESKVCTNEEPNTDSYQIFEPKRSSCDARERQHGDSFSVTDKPPEEFCLSPEAPSDLLSIDLLHKRSILKAVRLAVGLITDHFNSSRDLDEKIRLGNSSLCTTISHLILKQLNPTIQNILQDGLRAYKLDLIIGQRRNKLWNVIEATTRPSSSRQLPDCLVSVVKKCSQLSSHVRLSVFIIELLNLRALDFWIHHLYTCIDVVTKHYHQWGFLALAQGPTYGPLFQELLLLLQPLSLLPFDLHLPSESNLQSKEKLKHRAELPHHFLAQSAQILQMSSIQKNSRSPTGHSTVSNLVTDDLWLNKMPTSQSGTQDKEEEAAGRENGEMAQSSTSPREDKPLGELRWARFFGSGVGIPVGPQWVQKNISGPLRSRRPSEWLKLGASKVDLLAQSVWTRKWPDTNLSGNHDRDTAHKDEISTLKSPHGV